MRYILILLLLTLQARGQQLFRAHNRPAAAAGYARPLDALPGAAVAYGLRDLGAAYSGPVANIRRSSDGATLDIGTDADGHFDAAAFTAFVGAGTGYVTTLYDQSGSGVNAVQPTAAAQPALVLNGHNGRAVLDFSGGGKYLTFTTAALGGKYLDFFTTITSMGTGTYGTCFLSWGDYFSGTYVMWTSGAGSSNFYLQDGSDPSSSGGAALGGTKSYLINMHATATTKTFRAHYQGSSSSGQVVTVSEAPHTTPAGVQTYTLFRQGPNPEWDFSGQAAEFILYDAEQGSGRTAVQQSVNEYYAVYS